MAVGLIIFLPVLFALDGDGPEVQEYARLKGIVETLEVVAIQRDCDVRVTRAEPDTMTDETARDLSEQNELEAQPRLAVPEAADTPAVQGKVAVKAPLKIAVLPYAGYFPFDGLTLGKPERGSDPFSAQIMTAITETVPDANIVIVQETLNPNDFNPEVVWTEHTAEKLRPDVPSILSEARQRSIDALVTIFWKAYGIQNDIETSHLFLINAHTGTVLDRVVKGGSVQAELGGLLARLRDELDAQHTRAQIASARPPDQSGSEKQPASIRPRVGAGVAPSSSPYKAAIFPGFHADWPRCEALNAQLGRELTAQLSGENAFNVKQSAFPHDAREQICHEFMWSDGGEPNYNVVYNTAPRYSADVAVMASMDCEGKSGAVPVRLYMVDVQIRRTYSVRGFASKVSTMLEEVKSQFEKGRYFAQGFSRKRRNE